MISCLCPVIISDINPLELIGEEIYDEFDFEAANGTISSFVPSEHANTNGTETSPRVAPQINDVSATTSSVLRPLNTRGLSFLRSTSAPPSPRNRSRAPSVFSVPGQAPQPNTPVPPSTTTPIAPAAIPGSPEMTMITSPDEPKAKGEMSNESSIVSASESPSPSMPWSITPMKKRPVSSSGVNSPLVTSMSPRSASPAPSLEAVLLDRKRRLAAAGKDATGSMTAPSLPGTNENHDARAPALRAPATSKGTSRFKSSPLGGGEQTGIVIAEKVQQDTEDQAEDIRIPDEMDKAGPDKKEDDSGYL